MSLAIVCPHCAGTLTWNQTDASVPCPHCSKVVEIAPAPEPLPLPDESPKQVSPEFAGESFDFNGSQLDRTPHRVDRIFPEWQTVYGGLSVCWSAAILATGSMTLALCCGVSPGRGGSLSAFIPFVLVFFPIVVDLAGRRYCTSVPDATGQSRATAAMWLAVGFLCAWLTGVAIRLAEVSNSPIVPLVGLVLELGFFAAAAAYWIWFLHALGEVLKSRELCRKVTVFGWQFAIVFGLVLTAIVGGSVVSLLTDDSTLLRVALLASGLAAVFLLIRHAMLLSFARVTVRWRAPLLDEVLELDDDRPQDSSDPPAANRIEPLPLPPMSDPATGPETPDPDRV